jgi:hypothetical protein
MVFGVICIINYFQNVLYENIKSEEQKVGDYFPYLSVICRIFLKWMLERVVEVWAVLCVWFSFH